MATFRFPSRPLPKRLPLSITQELTVKLQVIVTLKSRAVEPHLGQDDLLSVGVFDGSARVIPHNPQLTPVTSDSFMHHMIVRSGSSVQGLPALRAKHLLL